MKVLTRDEIGRLSPTERLALIADLWDSLDDAPVSTPQAAELRSRIASFDDDVASGVTWDQLRTELAARTR